jgi:hypothetical protein
MIKKIAFGVAAVALATIVMAPSASASCPGPRTANTYNGGTGAYTYWHSPSGDTTGTLVSQAWQLGSPATFNSTGCPTFLYFSPNGSGIGLGADFSTCGVGCPAAGSTLAVLAQKIAEGTSPVVDFLIATVAETPTGGSNFDYSTQGAHNMIQLPAPTVLNSGPRSGTLLPLHVSIPSIGGGLYGPNAASAITGFRVVASLSAVEPTRDSAQFIPVTGGAITSPGGAAVGDTLVTLDCGTAPGVDGWVAVQLSLENGAVLGGTVSKPKRVHCQGALAEPKFKPIKKGNAYGHDQQ